MAKNNGTPITSVKNLDISRRIGIDLNIVNLQNPDDFLWLMCLIWPELIKRKQILNLARTIHLQYPKQLFSGDFKKLIPPIFDDAEINDSQIIIFHTHVANQFPLQIKEDLLAMLDRLSYIQTIYHVYNNMNDCDLHVDFIDQGVTESVKTLKNIDGHGNFFSWN